VFDIQDYHYFEGHACYPKQQCLAVLIGLAKCVSVCLYLCLSFNNIMT